MAISLWQDGLVAPVKKYIDPQAISDLLAVVVFGGRGDKKPAASKKFLSVSSWCSRLSEQGPHPSKYCLGSHDSNLCS